jgi:uncharacterized DUF497 family protein
MPLRIASFHWTEWLVDKIIEKHGVWPEEVESALVNDDPAPRVRRQGDRYRVYAQVEDDGEFLLIVLAQEPGRVARIITARPMEADEKSNYRKWLRK